MADIGCQHGAHATIVDNLCEQNQMAGIGVRDAQATIQGNRCMDNRLAAIGVPEGGRVLIMDNHLSRKGGRPPLVAIRGGAQAVIVGNTLEGGGVAAILLQGDATISRNTFQGAGQGQGSAVWAWRDSSLRLRANHFRGYGAALTSDQTEAHVIGNQIHEFGDIAIQLRNPGKGSMVISNRAWSDQPDAKVVGAPEEGVTQKDNVVVPVE